MGVEIIVPLALFFSIVAVVWLIGFFSHRKRLTAHETIRHAISNGQNVSSDLIEDLTALTDPVRADLRRGVLLIALGVAIFCLGLFISSHNSEPVTPILGVASFPVIMGLAYIGLGLIGRRNQKR